MLAHRAAGSRRYLWHLPHFVADERHGAVVAARFVVENHEDADEVVILTVFPLESRPGADGGGRREHDEEIQKCTRGALQAIEEGGIHGRIIVGYGKPAEEILRAADEERADVIAVGRRGAGLSKAVLGSTSDAVLKKSKRPVVVID